MSKKQLTAKEVIDHVKIICSLSILSTDKVEKVLRFVNALEQEVKPRNIKK